MKRVLVLILGVFIMLGTPAHAQEPVYSIENITGDLYRFQSNNHYGVFLVTDEGIILADPINAATATWLKGELDERFGLPVKYVIYSHDHADHTSGGEVFADTATFVGHAYSVKKIEESGHTPVPDLLVLEERDISLGEDLVKLLYYGPSHSENLLTIFFPNERAVFLVDAVGVKRLPFRKLNGTYILPTIDYLSEVEQLEFEILIPGHGNIGIKEDLTDHKRYLETLMAGVLAQVEKQIPLENIKNSDLLEEYSGWAMYKEWREMNIEGAHGQALSNLERQAEERQDYSPIKSVDPVYPRNALQMDAEGWVIVDFDVDAQGKPVNFVVVASDATTKVRGIKRIPKTAKLFEKAALRAFAKYRFEKNRPFEDFRAILWFLLAPPENNGSDLQMEGLLARGNLPRANSLQSRQ